MTPPRRDRNPGNPRNWTLECCFPGCDQQFRRDSTVGVLAAHWATHEAEAKARTPVDEDVVTFDAGLDEPAVYDPEKPHVELKWIGLGPAPQPRH